MTKKIILLLSTILLFAGVAHSQEIKDFPPEYINIAVPVEITEYGDNQKFVRKRHLSFRKLEDGLGLAGFEVYNLGQSFIDDRPLKKDEFITALEWLKDTTNTNRLAKRLGFDSIQAEGIVDHQGNYSISLGVLFLDTLPKD